MKLKRNGNAVPFFVERITRLARLAFALADTHTAAETALGCFFASQRPFRASNPYKRKKEAPKCFFFSWSGLRDTLGSLSRSPTRTRPPKQPPAVSLLRNGLFEPRILINAKKKHRSASFFSWSGLRDSNSLPPPWQGGALPDELNPHVFS